MRQTPSITRPSRGVRTLRRRMRTALGIVTLAGLAVGGVVAVAPAEAAADRPTVRAVAGDSSLTATWSAVPSATRYVLRVSEKRSFAHAKTVSTTRRTSVVRGLRNGHRYYVAVRAVRADLAASSVVSNPVQVTAHRGVPTPVGAVHVAPGALPNTITVRWTGGDVTQKVGVIASSTVTMGALPFHSAWYPATTRSITITVPASARKFIGAGSGNPVYVRVVQSNSPSTVFHPTYDYTDKYRASPVGSWTFAKAATAAASTTSRLRVAELNTQTNGSSRGFAPVDQWSARMPRVAKLVESANPDLFLTAELSTNADSTQSSCSNTQASPYRCGSITQYRQLARLLAPKLALADGDAYARVLDLMRSNVSRFAGKVTDGAHIFYNPNALKLLDHGYFSPVLQPSQSFANVTGLGVPGWEGTPNIGGDRWLGWAKFRTTDGTNREFYAVAAHFPSGDSAGVTAARYAEAKLARAAIDRLAGTLPVVFGGDFNSDAIRSTTPVQPVFIADGWFDAAAVAPSARTNMRFNTANGSGPQTGPDSGYPVRPYLQKWPTSRIDYILLKNSPHSYRYENVLRRTATGDFDHSYQGTDHNMQLATVGIGDPAP